MKLAITTNPLQPMLPLNRTMVGGIFMIFSSNATHSGWNVSTPVLPQYQYVVQKHADMFQKPTIFLINIQSFMQRIFLYKFGTFQIVLQSIFFFFSFLCFQENYCGVLCGEDGEIVLVIVIYSFLINIVYIMHDFYQLIM